MTDARFEEMAGRIDGVARALTTLICQLEDSSSLDGTLYSQRLNEFAEGRGKAGFETAARVMQQIAHDLDAARHNRSLAR